MTKYNLALLYLLLSNITLNYAFTSIIHHHRNTRCNASQDNIPSIITHPVLLQVYPALLNHQKQYGNPNIPLGSTEGKFCKTLRRLYLENKLSSDEIQLLEDMNFRLRNLEEIFDEADFNDIVARLKSYKAKYGTMQVPKKFNEDPELGAWVAMARRVSSSMDAEKRSVLDSIGFEWESSRKCGSSFMTNFRGVREAIDGMNNADDCSVEEIVNRLSKDQRKWLNAQKLACEKGNLVEARIQYLDNLLPNWRNVDY